MTRFRHMILMQYMFHDEMRVVGKVNGCTTKYEYDTKLCLDHKCNTTNSM